MVKVSEFKEAINTCNAQSAKLEISFVVVSFATWANLNVQLPKKVARWPTAEHKSQSQYLCTGNTCTFNTIHFYALLTAS